MLTRPGRAVLSVTLALVREGAELSFTVSANAESFGPILSSLAGPLPAGEPGALLIVRAGNANAFDATPGHPELWLGLDPTHLQVDQHLVSALFEPDVSLPLALRELQSVQQSLGALIELGLEPAGARAELARRADIAGTTVAVASRALLAEVPLARPGDDG